MTLHERLRADLKTAMKDRDKLRVDTVRSLMGIIDNAGAIDIDPGPYDPKVGLGHDLDRREVTDDEIKGRFGNERDDLLQAASEFRDLGHEAKAEELETRAGIVTEYMA